MYELHVMSEDGQIWISPLAKPALDQARFQIWLAYKALITLLEIKLCIIMASFSWGVVAFYNWTFNVIRTFYFNTCSN